MIGRVNTGGGIKLPFRVIGGTTQPSNPKDGTIWVKTSIPITHFEFSNPWSTGRVGSVCVTGTVGGKTPTGTQTVVWVLDSKVGGIAYREKITLTGCKQVQRSTGNWLNLYAYVYYNGNWTQFSSENVIPEFTYTGDYEIVNDSDKPITTSQDNWKVRFLTSGTLTFSELNGAGSGIDVFLVGGGGGSGWTEDGAGGGGGGYTKTYKKINVASEVEYSIVIGSGGTGLVNGGNTSAFSITASGGKCNNKYTGGDGGSGGGGYAGSKSSAGSGGSDGENGDSTNRPGGVGQGSTTREFGEISNTLYAGGGGGASNASGVYPSGGSGGGGSGGDTTAHDGQTNTGGGAGGGILLTKTGGSGIVIIRNARGV